MLTPENNNLTLTVFPILLITDAFFPNDTLFLYFSLVLSPFSLAL